MIYKIIRIDEDDYGCEERPDDYVPMVQVRVRSIEENDFGEYDEQIVLMEDSVMYERNLDEGDECVLGFDGELYPAGVEFDDKECVDSSIKQSEWMDSYLEAVEEMENL